MLSFEELIPRISCDPWRLYQAEHLASRSSSAERDGFYVGMLKADLQQQRYAYELSMVQVGVEWRRASEVIFALLSDFSKMGYDRDPAALVCDFADVLLRESTGGNDLLLELHSLPREFNYSRSRRFRKEEDPDGQGGTLPSLGLIPRWSVKRARSGVSQAPVASGGPAVVIPRVRIERLRLRRDNLRNWKRTIRGLRQVDAAKGIWADLDRLAWEGYDFLEVVATEKRVVAATTARIGWDGRGTFSESVTSPYGAFRSLRFVRFWVEAVEDSVAFVNKFTSNESLYGSDAFTFSLSGLPSPQELSEAMRGIQNGSVTVEKVYSAYLFPRTAMRRSRSREEP